MQHLREAWREQAASWRGLSSSPIWREHDAVIMTQFRGRDRYYELYVRGRNVRNFPRLAEAQSYMAERYGNLQWERISMPDVEAVHYYFGPTVEFTDPQTVYVASF